MLRRIVFSSELIFFVKTNDNKDMTSIYFSIVEKHIEKKQMKCFTAKFEENKCTP